MGRPGDSWTYDKINGEIITIYPVGSEIMDLPEDVNGDEMLDLHIAQAQAEHEARSIASSE